MLLFNISSWIFFQNYISTDTMLKNPENTTFLDSNSIIAYQVIKWCERKLRDFDAVACSEYGISNLFNHRRVVKCWHLIYMWLGNCVICKGYYHAIALRRVITSTINMILSFFSLKTRGNIDLLVTHCTLVNEYPLHLNYAVWIL